MFESEGLQKALSFLFMGVVGRVVKSRFTTAQVAGIQRLILDVMLPCVIFKALCSIKLERELMKWPALGLAFVLFHLLAATAYCGAAFPTLETPRISSLFQLATSAPGLSAMVFVKEFVGDEAAGKAALFDLPTKLYLIFALPKLLEAFGRTEVSRVRKQQSLAGIAKDPLNVAIVAGIIMAATGTPFSSLSFVGRGAAALATCQTPVLFVLIGMKINFSGATPAVSLALLSLRHAASYIFFVIATTLLESSADGQRDDLLTLLLLCQAAVSVIGWSQMNKAKDAGVKGYDTAFAFDIVGFSMPVTMILQTTACLLDRSTALDTIPYYAAPVLCAVGIFAIFSPLRTSLRDAALWEEQKES